VFNQQQTKQRKEPTKNKSKTEQFKDKYDAEYTAPIYFSFCCSVWAWCKPGINSWLRAEPTFPEKKEFPPENFPEDHKKVSKTRKNREKVTF